MDRTTQFARAQLDSFLDMIAAERGAAENTLAAYRRDLEHFIGYLAHNKPAIGAVTADDISSYLGEISKSGLATASRARRLSAIRQFFRFLASEQIIAEDPALGFAGPKRERPLPKTLTIDEVDRLINAARARFEGVGGAGDAERFRALRLFCLI